MPVLQDAGSALLPTPMKSKLLTALWWALTLAWACLIFYLSTATFSPRFSRGLLAWVLQVVNWRLPQAEMELADGVLRKLAHVVEYAIFALLLYGRGGRCQASGVRSAVNSRQSTVEGNNRRAARARRAALCVLAAGAYALTDEFHQAWVPGRHASLLDCGLDTLGAALAILASLRREQRWGSNEESGPKSLIDVRSPKSEARSS